MIRPDLVQKAIIDMLRADVPLITALGGDTQKIQELEIQLQNFTYPKIGVDVQPQYPVGNGTDHTKLSTIHWMNRVYSEKPSSQEANYLLSLVINAQFNKQWLATDENNNPNFYLIRIDMIGGADNAIRIGDKLWVASATFESQVNLKTAP
jgi:hypothetical protein